MKTILIEFISISVVKLHLNEVLNLRISSKIGKCWEWEPAKMTSLHKTPTQKNRGLKLKLALKDMERQEHTHMTESTAVTDTQTEQ